MIILIGCISSLLKNTNIFYNFLFFFQSTLSLNATLMEMERLIYALPDYASHFLQIIFHILTCYKDQCNAAYKSKLRLLYKNVRYVHNSLLLLNCFLIVSHSSVCLCFTFFTKVNRRSYFDESYYASSFRTRMYWQC